MNINRNLKLAIKNNEFGLSCHPVFSHNPKRLMDIRFKESCELFERRLGNINISIKQLISLYYIYYSKITLLEEEIKFKLEKIAEDTIREMYNVPQEIDILPKIVDQEEIEYEYEHESQEENRNIEFSPEKIKKIQEEANKRIILNSIVHGSSVLIWSNAYYIAKEKLDELNNKLIETYNIYSAIVNCLLWMQGPENDLDLAIKQGICEVNFEEGLNCEGVNFPVLLMETNKVVIDYLICKGIPKEFSEEELELYYAIADNYNDEIWHCLLSPVLYSDFLETINTETQNIPEIISKLSQLNYKKLKEIFILIQSDKKEAKKKMKIYEII